MEHGTGLCPKSSWLIAHCNEIWQLHLAIRSGKSLSYFYGTWDGLMSHQEVRNVLPVGRVPQVENPGVSVSRLGAQAAAEVTSK